jgi:hypothetical protein
MQWQQPNRMQKEPLTKKEISLIIFCWLITASLLYWVYLKIVMKLHHG